MLCCAVQYVYWKRILHEHSTPPSLTFRPPNTLALKTHDTPHPTDCQPHHVVVWRFARVTPICMAALDRYGCSSCAAGVAGRALQRPDARVLLQQLAEKGILHPVTRQLYSGHRGWSGRAFRRVS